MLYAKHVNGNFLNPARMPGMVCHALREACEWQYFCNSYHVLNFCHALREACEWQCVCVCVSCFTRSMWMAMTDETGTDLIFSVMLYAKHVNGNLNIVQEALEVRASCFTRSMWMAITPQKNLDWHTVMLYAKHVNGNHIIIWVAVKLISVMLYAKHVNGNISPPVIMKKLGQVMLYAKHVNGNTL